MQQKTTQTVGNFQLIGYGDHFCLRHTLSGAQTTHNYTERQAQWLVRQFHQYTSFQFGLHTDEDLYAAITRIIETAKGK